jgi:hypothetical protein
MCGAASVFVAASPLLVRSAKAVLTDHDRPGCDDGDVLKDYGRRQVRTAPLESCRRLWASQRNAV